MLLKMTATIQNSSFLRRLLDRLYPPHEEIAIYATAVGLATLAYTSAGFREALSLVVMGMLVELPAEAFQVSRLKGVVVFIGGVLMFLTFLVSLAISFYLPFTRQRLDVFVRLMIVAHVVLIFASNVAIVQAQQDVLSWILVVASGLYVFVFFIGQRYGVLDLVISDCHASPRQGVIAAVSVASLVAILSLGFNVHWAHCYAIATAFAIGMANAFEGSLQ